MGAGAVHSDCDVGVMTSRMQDIKNYVLIIAVVNDRMDFCLLANNALCILLKSFLIYRHQQLKLSFLKPSGHNSYFCLYVILCFQFLLLL
jgi:hypothetical protein